jgi:aminomethyltransferase
MQAMELKKTPLYQKHLSAGAKLVDFSGWAMPLEYKSTLKEALAVRASCGLFDASHMGQIKISADRSSLFLQQVASNDISRLKKGRLQYNLFLNEKGGVIDDCMIYNQGSWFLCVVNAANKGKVLGWLLAKAFDGVVIEDVSDELALLALQGPSAENIAAAVIGDSVKDLAYMSFSEIDTSAGKLLVSRSGYTGEDGFEIYLPNQAAAAVWDDICRAGGEALTLCGLGARDILRIEAGYPLYGHEINTEIDPFSASLCWAVKMDKEFIGRRSLLAAKHGGDSKKRIGFIMLERAVPREGCIVYRENSPIGRVSSGAFSPNTGSFIGMALVEGAVGLAGDEIEIVIRDRHYKARVAVLPFVRPRVKAAVVKK